MVASDVSIEATTVNQRVYSRLCELLAQGRWACGERLDERTLAQQLGVSRTPLREAVGRLVSEGVVEHRPYQGNFVRNFTRQQVHDLYEVRKSLESLAARLACEQITDEEVEQLRETVATCHEALDRGDLEAFEAADRRFHAHIVAAARNEILSFSLRPLALHVQLVRHLANMEPALREETRAHRSEIVQAIIDRDRERAASLLEQHISEVRDSVMRHL